MLNQMFMNNHVHRVPDLLKLKQIMKLAQLIIQISHHTLHRKTPHKIHSR